MKKHLARAILLVVSALTALCIGAIFAGCAVAPPATSTAPALTPLQQAQIAFAHQCTLYGDALKLAAQLRSAGKLSQQAIDQINIVDSHNTPLCTGPLPTDLNAATAQIVGAVAAVGVAEGVKSSQGAKK